MPPLRLTGSHARSPLYSWNRQFVACHQFVSVTSFLWTASSIGHHSNCVCGHHLWAPASGQAGRKLRLYTSTPSNLARLRLGLLGFGCPASFATGSANFLLCLTKTTRCDKGINTGQADSAQDFEFIMCVDPAAENSGRLGQSDPP